MWECYDHRKEWKEATPECYDQPDNRWDDDDHDDDDDDDDCGGGICDDAIAADDNDGDNDEKDDHDHTGRGTRAGFVKARL